MLEGKFKSVRHAEGICELKARAAAGDVLNRAMNDRRQARHNDLGAAQHTRSLESPALNVHIHCLCDLGARTGHPTASRVQARCYGWSNITTARKLTGRNHPPRYTSGFRLRGLLAARSAVDAEIAGSVGDDEQEAAGHLIGYQTRARGQDRKRCTASTASRFSSSTRWPAPLKVWNCTLGMCRRQSSAFCTGRSLSSSPQTSSVGMVRRCR